MLKIVIIYFSVIVCIVNAGNIKREFKDIPKELAHKQGCYIEEIKDVIPFHKSAAPVGDCKRINCLQDTLTVDTCDDIATDDPKCFITDIDYNRFYPDCCPTVECDMGISQI